MYFGRVARLLSGITVAVSLTGTALASSHSDAPLIKLDPQANLTDVYSFVGTKYNNPNIRVLNVVIAVRPFCEPGDGVIYDKFSDDARYSIHIANPNTGQELRRYDFRFSGPSEDLKNRDTIFSYGRANEIGPILDNVSQRRNYTQVYSVFRTSGFRTSTLGSDLLTPPPNVGRNTTPEYNDTDGFAVSGAATEAGLDVYTRNAVHELPTGEVVFAGPRDDGFFADTPGIFDLLDSRIVDNDTDRTNGFAFGNLGGLPTLGQRGGGVDGFKGFNVLVYAIQIPISDLPAISYTPVFAGAFGTSAEATRGVGVFATVSRPRITLRSEIGAPVSTGAWVQVNRLGNPLFNEVLVALRDKDRFNRTQPRDDVANGFETYALNPEVAVGINALLFGTDGTTPLAISGRTDLRAVYIPDVLRVSTQTDPVRLPGTAGFSRFGFLGGDTVSEPGGQVRSGGWPNGRRLGDDVVDIALTAVASGPTYASPIIVGDNADMNDLPYHQVFPYSATPHAGASNRKDSL
ncbi:MAG: DUF4331 domain-containing protein [Capsulimonadales bacterium]|nr:DUF4331 domain-containing protein [Capsulimonadales bacterium]